MIFHLEMILNNRWWVPDERCFCVSARVFIWDGNVAIVCRMNDAFLKCFTYGLSVDISKFYFLRNGNFHSVNKLLYRVFFPRMQLQRERYQVLSTWDQKYNLFMFVCHFSFSCHTHAGFFHVRMYSWEVHHTLASIIFSFTLT